MKTLAYVVHYLVCFILIGVVLLQRGKGQDIGASLGGGSANAVFGSRGAGNFLTKITTGSAIIFMGTSLYLSYLGYTSSDVRLFEESAPFVPEGSPAATKTPDTGLQEIPAPDGADAAAAASDAEATGDASGETAGDAGGLTEVPSAQDGAAVAAPDSGSAVAATPDAAKPDAPEPAALPADAASESTPADAAAKQAAPTAP